MASTADVAYEPGAAARTSYALAWLLVALLYVAVFTGSGAPTLPAMRAAMALALPNAVFGVASLGIARRWPWPGNGRRSEVARIVLAGVVIAAGVTLGWCLLSAVDQWIWTGHMRPPPPVALLWQSVINVLLQLCLVAAGYARHNDTRARAAQARAQRAEALQARAELHLLRTQLNPHFILNTLHALLGLVRRDPATAENAIERLGELLRFGMSVEQRRTDLVAVREEWAFVLSYLELERLRLGDRLRLEVSADPSVMDLHIPPFAIQPLVENAITHAIATRGSGGKLSVSVRRHDTRVWVEVADDGPGASEADIFASPRQGLRLLRERLATLYAGNARLVFGTAEGGGLEVLLDLPAAHEGDAA